MSGWICSYRAVWEHPIFEGDALRVGVWHWMLHKAVWKPRRFKTPRGIITLNRGQLCVSQRQVCDETGMSHQRFRTFLSELTATQAITHEATHGRTVITICKYDNYQNKDDASNTDENTAATQQQHTKEQRNNITNTFSNEKEQASPVPISVLTKAVWDCGVQYLTSKGIETRQARSVLGKWRKDSGDAQILESIEAAQRAGTEDPIPYITKTLQGDEAFDVMAALAKLRKERA